MTRLPYSFAKENKFIILEIGNEILLQYSDVSDLNLIPEILRLHSNITKFEEISLDNFDAVLTEYYRGGGLNADIEEEISEKDKLYNALQGAEQSADLLDSDNDAPIVRLVNSLFDEAVNSEASDIHLEPFENNIAVRLRVDGVLNEIASLSSKLAPYLVSRIKVMSKLDIAEKRLPQDGRLSVSLGKKIIDVRVSTLPIRNGERVVMRILDKENALIGFDELGMSKNIKLNFQKSLKEPNGIIFVTGPTGSGKTTTLYAALDLINDKFRNIITVEDPIEYAINGISQTQVNSKVGMSFAAGLRSILRQDHDVVMVGEIRDKETAEIAVQASLTGHLVLSTMHTNSASSALARLTDMGIEPFLISSSIKAILAQRLVRKLCDNCKALDDDVASQNKFKELAKKYLIKENKIFKSVGCNYCQAAGYKGRLGIYELISIDEEIKKKIYNGVSEQEIEDYCFKKTENMESNAVNAVANGLTTIEEIYRVIKFNEYV